MIIVENISLQLQMNQDLISYHRIHFLYASLVSGLLEALKIPASRDKLIGEMQVQRPEFLDDLLELGVLLKELSCENGCYKIVGGYSQLMSDKECESLAAVIKQIVTIIGPVYTNLAGCLKGGPGGNYLAENGAMFAQASRILEKPVANFIKSLLDSDQSIRILDVGCGSGIYLRYAAQMNSLVNGVGLDIQEDVIILARDNLLKWGISDKFIIILEDIRHYKVDTENLFNYILLINNICYFKHEERLPLFRRLRSMLAPQGKLILVSMIRQKNVNSIVNDLILRSTIGCVAKPKLDELTSLLEGSGFGQVEYSLLAPGLYGWVATNF